MIREHWLSGRKTRGFVLQWHVTQRCPFHCRHCYDREARTEPTWAQAKSVLADLQAFCRQKRVEPQVCLTGGDPLWYTHFWPLYEAIAEAGVPVSILGNPIPPETIQRLLAVQAPVYYQVSLEGLAPHNDHIRGAGHFELTQRFLADARAAGLNTHVMLTLTRDNIGQVLPLAETLRGLTTRFTFNRLAQVGQGQNLDLPAPETYAAFLEDYTAACCENPVLGLKDNLINVLRHQRGREPFPGCTGHGCGAAFNFVALLPDGEVHACRKFPSPLGNIYERPLLEIYDSDLAQSYRAGPEDCRECDLKQFCRGCLAVSYGAGLEPLKSRDPFCFLTAPQPVIA